MSPRRPRPRVNAAVADAVEPWATDELQVVPLTRDDPPRVGGFWLDARVTASEAGVAYVAHDDERPVLLVLLSDGAAADAAARDRLAGAVDAMHIDTVVARGGAGQDTGRFARVYRPSDAPEPPPGTVDSPEAPWVALAYDGSAGVADEARRILAAVGLTRLDTTLGTPAGPGYEHYWLEQARPGVARMWPLPWPGRYDRAGWVSILASWLLMLLLACLAVLIAILLFQNAPQQQPPPPVPTSASGSGSPQSPSSGSPSSSSSSSSSASPSDSSSPSQSSSPSNSASASPTPTDSPSGAGTPTQNSKL